jgi:hypothetical protein
MCAQETSRKGLASLGLDAWNRPLTDFFERRVPIPGSSLTRMDPAILSTSRTPRGASFTPREASFIAGTQQSWHSN